MPPARAAAVHNADARRRLACTGTPTAQPRPERALAGISGVSARPLQDV